MESLFIFLSGAVFASVISWVWSVGNNNKDLINSINFKLNNIMASQAQHAKDLKDLTAQNEKARLEILAKFTALEAAIAAGGETTPEVDEAMVGLKASIQTDDDLHPDA